MLKTGWGSKLKELRKSSKYTVTEISAKMGIAIRSLYTYEDEQRVPSVEAAIKICDFYGVNVDDIFQMD